MVSVRSIAALLLLGVAGRASGESTTQAPAVGACVAAPSAEELERVFGSVLASVANATQELEAMTAYFEVPVHTLLPLNFLLRHLFRLELVPSYPHHAPYLRQGQLISPDFKRARCDFGAGGGGAPALRPGFRHFGVAWPR